ncbi:transcription factor domain-containing protein [Aspergillus lucknowensis]|uniref:Zn(2)-C6 fungal-type domain-containing protein n=1 Tax=Aspergillus lucknowensis TaxID=176173 RepID=A0ABR4LIU6_9EURO
MGPAHAEKRISCTRCQSKKIRCNRAGPPCDKCDVASAECRYLPRKPRIKRQADQKATISDFLQRLERLEDHVRPNSGIPSRLDSPRLPSLLSGEPRLTDVDRGGGSRSSSPTTRAVTRRALNGPKKPRHGQLLFASCFIHLRNVQSLFFENERFAKAMELALAEIERLEDVAEAELATSPPLIPKETAKKWLHQYYETYHFWGYQLPFDRQFMMSIPDLLEMPHVQLDSACQIIYYTTLRHGLLLDSDNYPGKSRLLQHLYHKSMSLAETWLGKVQNSPADLCTATFMTSLAMESFNIELSWHMLGRACTIARTLGYFFIDGNQENAPGESLPTPKPIELKTEVAKNRKRFEFWHLVRADCLFRLSFGKPTLIPQGSWAVNFPDLTIDGVGDASTRFIQIHFLASLRLALVVMKYLNLAESETSLDLTEFDTALDGLIAEVRSISSDWNAEELLSTTMNQLDAWFCLDILFNSSKMLIVLYQAKKCNEGSSPLSDHAVDIARKCLQTVQSLIGSTLHKYWGPSLVGMLLHLIIPVVMLCVNFNGDQDGTHTEGDHTLVAWVHEFVEKTAEERVELRPVKVILTTIIVACQQVSTQRA